MDSADERLESAVSELFDLVASEADKLRPADSSAAVDRPNFDHLLRRDLRRFLTR